MKFKLLSALLVSSALTMSAQGYKDGIEYYKAGQYENAITLLQRNKDNAGADKALAEYYLGQSYLAMDDLAKAKAAFEAGVAADAENPFNYIGLGAIQMKNNNVTLARDNFKKAKDLAKKNTEVLVDIARAYFDANPTLYAKDIDKLITEARKKSKNMDPSIYMFEGDREAKAGNFNEAASQYEMAIRYANDNATAEAAKTGGKPYIRPDAYVKYANVYYNLNPKYAIDKIHELLKLNPTSALAQRELAEKFYQNGQWTRAAEQYSMYMNNPNHFPEDEARYAVLLFAGAKYPEAARVSRDILSKDPENFQAGRVLVRSLFSAKDPSAVQAAKEFMTKPSFKGRYNASDYTTYSTLLMADSLTRDQALQVLLDGNAALPNTPEINSAISDYYFEVKDYPKAADYCAAMLKDSKDLDPADYYMAALNFLGAASSLSAEPEQAKKYAAEGVKIMDKAMEGLELAQIPPTYIRRKALIGTIGNGNVPDAQAAEAWKKLIDRLNLDSELANPGNENNRISYYVDAYSNLARYYDANGDEAALANAREELTKYKALQGDK